MFEILIYLMTSSNLLIAVMISTFSHWKSGKNWKSEIVFFSQAKIREFDKFAKNLGEIRAFDKIDKISVKNQGISICTKYK